MDLIINGVTLTGDLMDADFMDAFEGAMLEMRDKAQAAKTAGYTRASDHYRAQCEVTNECLDKIFGEGTSEKLFGGRMNVMEHLEAMEQVNEWAMTERKRLNDFTNKYTQRQQAAIRQQQAQQFVSGKGGHNKGKH